MAAFHILRAVERGYRTAWGARFFILRLAAPAFAATLACAALSAWLGLLGDPGGEALVGLPALAVQGWAAATLARLAVLPPGEALSRTPEAARARLAGAVAYVLLCLVGVLVLEALIAIAPPPAPGQPLAPPAFLVDPQTPMALQIAGAVGSLLTFVGVFWALRLGWLFVPAALDRPLSDYMRAMAGGLSSLSLLAVWAAGSIPPFLFALALADIAHQLALPGLLAVQYTLFVVASITGLVLTTLAATAGIDEAMHREA